VAYLNPDKNIRYKIKEIRVRSAGFLSVAPSAGGLFRPFLVLARNLPKYAFSAIVLGRRGRKHAGLSPKE